MQLKNYEQHTLNAIHNWEPTVTRTEIVSWLLTKRDLFLSPTPFHPYMLLRATQHEMGKRKEGGRKRSSLSLAQLSDQSISQEKVNKKKTGHHERNNNNNNKKKRRL